MKKIISILLTLTLLFGVCGGAGLSQALAVVDNSWQVVVSAGFSTQDAWYPVIELDGDGDPYVLYQDEAAGDKATVMRLSGSIWSLLGEAGFSAGIISHPSMAIGANGTIYAAYRDSANSNKITVMEFSLGSWFVVGEAGFSEGSVQSTAMAVDGSGIPYVAYYDTTKSRIVMMKYTMSAWHNVGEAEVSDCEGYYPSIAFDSQNNPYVAFQDGCHSDKATVMKYTSADDWQPVGLAGFSAGQANFVDLAIDSSGTPYVAYQDLGNDYQATVMKYDGENWVSVGTAGFTADKIVDAEYGNAEDVTIAIDGNGTPYVALNHTSLNSKACVFKYDGSDWNALGPVGFTSGYAYSLTMDIHGSDVYVAFRDGANADKATVMKYVQSSNGIVDPLTVTTGSLPEGTVGIPYSETLVGTGGTEPYTWSAAGLPVGLEIAANGQISGTPATAGTYTISVTLTDNDEQSVSKDLSLIIGEGLRITTESLPEGTVDTPYSFTLAGEGGVQPYSWSGTILSSPSGLVITTAGEISGTPVTAGTLTVTVVLSDDEEQSANKEFQLVVAEKPIVEPPAPEPPVVIIPALKILTEELPAGLVGEEYTWILEGTGGLPPYNWTVGGLLDGLPEGLELTSGRITGTPVEASGHNVGIILTDMAQGLRYMVYNLKVVDVFSDISGHESKAQIMELVSRGILDGYPDGTFRPDNYVTRAEFAKILVTALGIEINDTPSFSDTAEHWASPYINTVAHLGIIEGYDAMTFGPDEYIQREQMAAVVTRLANLEGEFGEQAFLDRQMISQWALEYVDAACGTGLMEGFPDNTFRPDVFVKRAEAAETTCSLLDYLEDSE